MYNTTPAGPEAKLETSFVPHILQRQLLLDPQWRSGEVVDQDHVALLWVDIVGFSGMCNRIFKDVHSGVNKITKVLEEHYDFVLEAIAESGGEPLFYVGDGVMGAWTGTAAQAEDCIHHAIMCAQRIIDGRTAVDDLGNKLDVHLLVAYGDWAMAGLNGALGHKLLSFYGEAFYQIEIVARNRAPNQVLIANRALDHLSGNPAVKKVQHDSSILLDRLPQLFASRQSPPEMSVKIVDQLKAYAPRTVSFPLKRDRLRWVAEIRPVSVLFVRLPNTGKNKAETLRQLQLISRLVEPLIIKYGGLLNQIWIDDKETNVFISFGPAPSNYLDNPERCVRLAHKIHHTLRAAGLDNGAGVATGKAYCGFIGNDTLRQYTMIGDVVNLSARLAGVRANAWYCDEATYQSTKKVLTYDPAMEAQLKGQAGKTKLYLCHPPEENEISRRQVDRFIGREKELKDLNNSLYLAKAGISNMVLVEGEDGIGKSSLLRKFSTVIDPSNTFLLTLKGNFILRRTPFSSWQSIMTRLLGVENLDPFTQQDAILAALPQMYSERFALLNLVLQTSFPEVEATIKMTSSQRKAATLALLLEVIAARVEEKTVVLIVEKGQWVDESSWELLASVQKMGPKCLTILTHQPAETNPHLVALLSQVNRQIKLEGLPLSQIAELMRLYLEVEVTNDLAEFVAGITKGNPFFVIELTIFLLDQGLIIKAGGQGSLSEKAKSRSIMMPETIRGAVRQRLDNLDPGPNLALKVGSVAGAEFSETLVSWTFPITSEKEQVPSYLLQAQEAGFIFPHVVDNLSGYAFDNITISEVAYEMTLIEQRRELHAQCAGWYEEVFAQNLNPFFVSLAHHWLQSGNLDAAASYKQREAKRLSQLGLERQALEIGLEGISLYGYEFPKDLEGIGASIGENMMAIPVLVGERDVSELIDHWKSQNERTDRIIRMILELLPSAHNSGQVELYALMAIVCLRLTLEEGQGKHAGEVYAHFAIVQKSMNPDSRVAYAWSQLAMAVNKKLGNRHLPRVNFIHGWFIASWIEPLRQFIHLPAEGAEAGLRSGDIVYGCFNLALHTILLAVAGRPLTEVIDTAVVSQRRLNNQVRSAAFHLEHEIQFARALMGRTAEVTELNEDEWTESSRVERILETDLYHQIGFYHVSKVKLNVHVGNWKEATEWGDKAYELLPAYANLPAQWELEQYYMLAAFYRAAELEGAQRQELNEAALACLERMRGYAALCPENFTHKLLIAEAVCHGLNGITEGVVERFNRAAKLAAEQGFLQDQGLAYEYLARYQRARGADYTEAFHHAMHAYVAWGATGKVDYLLGEFVKN